MKNLLLLFLLITTNVISAQSEQKIIKSLKMVSHPLDEDADYSYLVNASQVSYDIPNDYKVRINKSYSKTIKIYNDKGLDLANVEIPVRKGNRDREFLKKTKSDRS